MKQIDSVAVYLNRHAERVESELQSVWPKDWPIPAPLKDAMNYSLLAGGKRLRPILVLAGAEAVGGSTDAALPVACAVEMVHTYSLIHDDLPAMDDDDFRRGKPTNHKVYGEAMAILAGDSLLTHAFYQVAQAVKNGRVGAAQALRVVEELSILAGPSGMVGGQAADILGEQGITDLSQLEFIHLHKTSDLIVFSLRAGAIVSGADERQLEALRRFGYNIGLAFQIQDDILDVIGDEGKLGKPVKSDEKQHKVTYPYFLGIQASQAKVEQLTDEGKRAVMDGSLPFPDRLLEIADFLMRRDH